MTQAFRLKPFLFTPYVALVAFCVYSCMYAFRKPLTVGTFAGEYWGVEYKILLITAQVIGYMLSKFIGIKVVSELSGNSRAVAILILVSLSAVALLLFPLTPAPYNVFWIFCNGLPLGMVFGLVFSYLEGRRTTELLGIGLSITQIFSSGFVKTIAKYLMLEWQVSEYWMPLLTGLVFFPFLFLFVGLLAMIPPPSIEDEQARTKRKPMNQQERLLFFRTFAPGLILLILAYIFLTAYRDFRDNFAADIWKVLGRSEDAMIFTQTEIPIFLVIMCITAGLVLIRDNQIAFLLNQFLVILGCILIGISTYFFEQKVLSPETWITLVGLGLYMGYVPFNIMLFDRMIAAFRYVGTAGFLIYVADSFGYLGSVAVLFYKNFGQSNLDWLQFFIQTSYILAVSGIVLTSLSIFYFWRKLYSR
jgi:hypothetical protein